METLLGYNYGEDLLGMRNRAMVELFYSSGLRVFELVSINLGDLDFSRKEIRIRGKGRKERIVPLTDDAMGSIRNYLHKRGGCVSSQPLFLNKKGSRITTRGVQYILEKLSKESGIYRKLTPTCSGTVSHRTFLKTA